MQSNRGGSQQSHACVLSCSICQITQCPQIGYVYQDFAEPELPAETVTAFETAFNNIHKFHTAQKQTIPLQVETMPGVQCRRLCKPIGKASQCTQFNEQSTLPSCAL